VNAQNAAIIMHHEQNYVLFEFFEISPHNEAVMNTEGRLLRYFPASCISMSTEKFNEGGLRSTLAQTIAKMSHQEVAEFKPKVMKAGEEHIEERDTTDPRLVTDFLATVLSALGKTVPTSRIWKNTREEVLWKDAKLPWRRSPLWLLSRVALQTVFSRLTPGGTLYKEFMVFLMSYILQAARSHEMPSDTLYCMIAKISRRLMKLDRNVDYTWLQTVEKSLSSARYAIEGRWKNISEELDSSLDLQTLSTLQFKRDTCASYIELDKFIRQIDLRGVVESDLVFELPHLAINFNEDVLPSIQADAPDEDMLFILFAFENWVMLSMQSWLGSHSAEKEACGMLYNSMRSYHRIASLLYLGTPENVSLMLLTVLEMWVGCDKSACGHHDLLSRYDPDIPLELFQSLILPFKSQMERLARAEAYVRARRNGATSGYPSIYSSFGQSQSFSVQYFAGSSDHQIRYQEIVSLANEERRKKKAEFNARKARYDELISLSNQRDCEYYDDVNHRTGKSRRKHRSTCMSCDYLKQAASLTIEVHEWPLPANELKTQSTVFELEVPQPFNDWRNAATYVRFDVLKLAYDESPKVDTKYTLEEYFSSYTIGDRRIKLVSTTKPNRGTHRGGKFLETATEQDVLVRNGLTYEYYDCKQDCFVSEAKITDEIPLACTYQLSNTTLQSFLFRPFHKPNGLSPNNVISEQANCPDHLTLEEFRAMATLPVGYRLQWSNILTHLYIPTIDFKKADTFLMLLQISCQAGPPLDNAIYRASHQSLGDDFFAGKLLHGLSLALNRIKENWESCHAVGGFISLTTRLLNVTSSFVTSYKYLAFLQECRVVALEWMHLLQDKIKRPESEKQGLGFILRVFEIAHVCISSFKIDERHLRKVLADPVQAAILVESSIVIQTTSHSALRLENHLHRHSTYQWKRLLYKSYPILLEEVLHRQNPCLDLAILKNWSDYPGAETWRPVSPTMHHYLTTNTRSRIGASSMTMHFNLLTAELLVKGLPLSRLPAKYEIHPSYEILFGRTTLEVMPTDIPGMQFSSKNLQHEYTLNFGMNDSNADELLLVTSKDGRTLDLVPSRVFENTLPHHFIHDYIHWYDRQSRTIEFRLKNVPWTSSPENWTMESTGSSWILKKEGQSLVTLTSSTAKLLSKLLEPVESDAYIHIALNAESCEVEIEMPRLQLGFLLRSDLPKLVSRQFRGMYVDSDQSIGTLCGLRSKLVLRDNQNRRKVLLPEGCVSWICSNDRVYVFIEHGTSKRVHQYDIDTMLGRLVDNGSLQSKLSLCYLHALTSYCLPDTLTGKTGTEEALSLLGSAAVRSFDCLSQENLDMLHCIAKLTPGREYYPAHEHVMQSVEWDNTLSSLSQHDGFYTSVKTIFEQASSTKFFYSGLYIEPPILDHVNDQLQKRQVIRGSTFQVSGFGAETYHSGTDETYKGRDQSSYSERSIRAFEVTQMVAGQGQALYRQVSYDFADHIWELLKDGEATQGPNKLAVDEVGYDAQWLGDSKSLLREYWCQLHHTLGCVPTPTNRFQTILCLATMAYADNGDVQAMQALAALATIPSVGQNIPPDASCFEIANGRNAVLRRIEYAAEQHLVQFWNSPESSLVCYRQETTSELNDRRHRTFEINRANAVERFVFAIQDQWICEIPHAPIGGDFKTYIDVSSAMEQLRSEWVEWYQNHLFYEYLRKMAMNLQLCTFKPIVASYLTTDVGSKPHALPRGRPFINDQDLFQHCILSLPEVQDTTFELCNVIASRNVDGEKMDTLLDQLEQQASQTYERKYVENMRGSLDSLKSQSFHSLLQNLSQCQSDVNTIYRSLENAVRFDSNPYASISAQHHLSSASVAGKFMAPRVSQTFFLRQLSRNHWQKLSLGWKKAIVAYGVALTNLQRARRLIKVSGNKADLLKELLNVGHSNWDPLNYPETLLLEVESGIMIREVQEEIAKQMRAPPGQVNAVMQLNMGEGKSSVIVPIIAALLADGTKLVRVVVAKPQAKELFRTLVSKLGGLLNHRIYHMPFSRSLRLTESDASQIAKLYKGCMGQAGVLLVQPEHMLSFKLMGIECNEPGRDEVGRLLLSTQHFFNQHSRDIVDESDENFNVKFELIYTMGMQNSIELSPERWRLIQRLLTMVAKATLNVQTQLPESIEISHNQKGRFPRTRLLRLDAQKLLISSIAHEICEVGLPGFPIGRQKKEVRRSVLNYISEANLSSDQIASVEGDSSFFTESTKGPLLLLRGLLAEGVLGFTLHQKRWRVNYGLDTNRFPETRLAVPYRAKDNPAARAEFSHPDVVIVLTCLSYYYGGLSNGDLSLAFEHLVRSDQADDEYDEWVKDAPNLHTSFHNLIGVNMNDQPQAITQIFPHLRYAKSVVDYFLARIVFPKEMKEFPHKLSASGWDIGQTKVHPTTGFSGTNDSRHLLPLDVHHLDLEEQRHTSALVLAHLLQPENKVTYIPRPKHTDISDAIILLHLVTSMEPQVQVILDVGAQILELCNVEVAQEWLKMLPREGKEAVVFFNDHDDLCVVNRKGCIEKLQTSHYCEQLDVCLVFLDEAHTRGTDLKLPEHYRAAVTLGASLTKDRLVQGKWISKIMLLQLMFSQRV
jgi:hypothetical protein